VSIASTFASTATLSAGRELEGRRTLDKLTNGGAVVGTKLRRWTMGVNADVGMDGGVGSVIVTCAELGQLSGQKCEKSG